MKAVDIWQAITRRSKPNSIKLSHEEQENPHEITIYKQIGISQSGSHIGDILYLVVIYDR